MHITAYEIVYEFVINFAPDASNPPFLTVYRQKGDDNFEKDRFTDNENGYNVPDLVISRVLRKFESILSPSYTSSRSIILDGALEKHFH